MRLRSTLLLALALLSAASVLASCGSDGSEEMAALNADPMFRVAPASGRITESVLPDSCPSDPDRSTGGNLVRFTFEDDPTTVISFYREQLGAHGWQVSGERQLGGVGLALDSQKVIDGDTYRLSVAIGSNEGELRGSTPEGSCSSPSLIGAGASARVNPPAAISSAWIHRRGDRLTVGYPRKVPPGQGR